MSLLALAGTNSATGGYDITNSLKFEPDNTEYLTRTPSSAGNEKTWTWSGWIKYTEPTLSPQTIFAGGTDSGSYGAINFRIDAGQLELNTASVGLRTATQKFRDPSAWYHFVVAMDTTQSTADDRIKIYVNGSQITDFSVFNNPPQNTDTGVNANELQTISRRSNANDRYFAGYMAEAHLIDGQALAPTDFGEFDTDTGIWKPKAYVGSYGTNGYYLKFDDSSSLGTDSSGNGNNFTLNNITSADQATDTPTNNFATTNPLYKYGSETFTTEGATVVTKNANGWVSPQSTICPASGKWYMEFKFNAVDSRVVGAAPIGGTLWNSATHYGGTVGSDSVGYADTGYLYVNDSGINPVYGPAYDNSNIIAVALDMDNGYIYWAKDNTWINTADPVAGSGGYALPAGLVEHAIGASVYQQAKQSFANFGGYTTISISSAASDANGYGTFEYAPPSGYYALCTKNLEEFG